MNRDIEARGLSQFHTGFQLVKFFPCSRHSAISLLCVYVTVAAHQLNPNIPTEKNLYLGFNDITVRCKKGKQCQTSGPSTRSLYGLDALSLGVH